MATTTTIFKGASAIIMAMSTLHFVRGTGVLGDSGVFVPKTQSTALAESQIRYLGSMAVALGAVSWWASSDLQERQAPLAFVGIGLFGGGLGRAIAGAKHGFGPRMRAAMWIELVVPVVLYGVGKVEGLW